MTSKRKLLEKCRLYLILDTQVADYAKLLNVAKKAMSAGVDIIQLRDKHGSARDIIKFSNHLIKLTRNKIPFIINDRADLAYVCNASGVHLGQDDMPMQAARKILGARSIIGVSCQSLAHVRKAITDGADYLGFGSVFKTQTKPERDPMAVSLLAKVAKVTRLKQIPIFAIGGITPKNLPQIQAVGVNRIAVCRAISEVKNVSEVSRNFKRFLLEK